MTALSIQPPFPIFADTDGRALEAGYVWLGVAGADPIASPITAYWDEALTQVVTQPVRTRGGFPLNGAAIGRLYVNSDYSILVRNRNGFDIYSAANATERYGNVISFADITGTLGSDRVTFLQAGTGAVSRTGQSKMRDVVSVKDFGAVGDGVTDDTAAIQAAITAAGVSGGNVVLSPGTYKISATLNLGAQNVSVQGNGRKVTKILQSTASLKTFNVTASYITLSSFSIEYASQGTSGGSAITISGAFYSTIDDLYVYKADIGVEYVSGANSNQLTRVVCEDCTRAGINIDSSANVMASTFQILNSNTTLCSLGCIRINGPSEGNNFMNGHTYQGAYSMTTGAASFSMGARPSYNKFHGVYLDASANGALIDKTVELDFIDCWFSSRPGNGAFVNQVDGVRFTGGGAINCDQRGVLVEAAAKRVVFKNFMARSNSVAAANIYDGIVFAPNTTDFVVQGCTFTNLTVTFGTQRYGVIVNTGTSDRYVIADNLVSGNGTGGVFDGGSGANKRVANNY